MPKDGTYPVRLILDGNRGTYEAPQVRVIFELDDGTADYVVLDYDIFCELLKFSDIEEPEITVHFSAGWLKNKRKVSKIVFPRDLYVSKKR